MDAIVEVMRQLPPPFNMVVLIVAVSCLAGLLGGVAKQVRVYFDHEADRRLKRDIVEAGYSLEEAERLVDLKATTDFRRKPAGSR